MSYFPAKRRALAAFLLMLLIAIPCFLAGFPMPLAMVTGFIFASTVRYVRR